MRRTMTKLSLLISGALLLALAMIPAAMPATYAEVSVNNITGTPREPEQPDPTEQPPGGDDDVPTPDDGDDGDNNDDGDDDRGSDDGDDDGDDGRSPRIGNPELTKAVNTDNATVGDTLEFTLTVTNHNGRSDNVVVNDTLHECFSITNATTSWGDIAVQGNTVTVDIGKLFEDDVVTIIIQATVACQPPEGESFNTANLSTTSREDRSDDNSSTVNFFIQPQTTVTPMPSPTPPPPTISPTVVMSPTMTPTPTPPPPPSTLPRTGVDEPGGSMIPTILALLGIGFLAFGLSIRKKTYDTSTHHKPRD